MAARILVFDPSFYKRADAFAQQHARYRQKDGTASMYHIINAVWACGYLEVNSDNIDDVMHSLEERAEQYEGDHRDLDEGRYPIDAEDI